MSHYPLEYVIYIHNNIFFTQIRKFFMLFIKYINNNTHNNNKFYLIRNIYIIIFFLRKFAIFFMLFIKYINNNTHNANKFLVEPDC